MYSILTTNRFEKDLKLLAKRGYNMKLLLCLLELLEREEVLAEKYKNHKLKNMNSEIWDCHIQPDWILLYERDEDNKIIKLIRTGTHTDLFK